MKTKGRPWQFFVVAILIFLFAYSAFFGIKSQYGDTLNTWIKGAADIRFGIDIRGGVDVTFMPADGYDATDEQLEAAKAVVEQRLVNRKLLTVKYTQIPTRTVSWCASVEGKRDGV